MFARHLIQSKGNECFCFFACVCEGREEGGGGRGGEGGCIFCASVNVMTASRNAPGACTTLQMQSMAAHTNVCQ